MTYGHNAIWQMWTPERPGPLKAKKSWRESLDDPGSYQMRHLRRLMESRPFATRIPDQSVILSPKGKGTDYIVATRDGTPGKSDATYLMAYTPLSHVMKLNSSLIPGKRLRAWWYDPRTGVAYYEGESGNTGEKAAPWHTRPFDSPGPDWVFVVDDATKSYPPPGQ